MALVIIKQVVAVTKEEPSNFFEEEGRIREGIEEVSFQIARSIDSLLRKCSCLWRRLPFDFG